MYSPLENLIVRFAFYPKINKGCINNNRELKLIIYTKWERIPIELPKTKLYMKTYKKLGFSNEETQELVDHLNKLLANYQVHYQKLRNFHWNIEGPDFFELHEQFEIEYDAVKAQIDEIAERIRVFGAKPISTMQGYIDVSEIEEVNEDIDSKTMVDEVLNDYEVLLSFLVDVITLAEKLDDSATEDMMTEYAKRTEQRHWMFTAFNSN